MTLNYSFDLEDDDFLNDTFLSISENDLVSHSVSSSSSNCQAGSKKLNDIESDGKTVHNPGEITVPVSNENSASTENENSLSFLFKARGESATLKTKEFSCDEICSPNLVDKSLRINYRFVPGIIPKAKKRKLPGPAGFLPAHDDQPDDCKTLDVMNFDSEIEVQNIMNSQFSVEDLHLPSWQNLQADVSSCQSLSSTAEYYSIRRVLHETSKKKLPKHIVVPVLCVLIKKLNQEESTIIFMDDTGEMSGKIDKEVLDTYKDMIRDGTALILKDVTCICNILILKKQSMISMYLDDGSTTHIKELNSILDKDPLKLMSCECPGTLKKKIVGKHTIRETCLSPSVFFETPSITMKMNPEISNNAVLKQCGFEEKSPGRKNSNKNVGESQSPGTATGKETMLSIFEATLGITNKDSNPADMFSGTSEKHITSQTVNAANYSIISSTPITDQKLPSKISRIGHNSINSPEIRLCATNGPLVKTSFEEDLFCDDSGMDDFDELLCSLDEKSFLEEM